MILLRIAAILFLFLSIGVSVILVRLLGLRKRGRNFADLAFPLLAVSFYLISDKAFYHSLLPELLLVLSLLALGITAYFIIGRRDFSYSHFGKFFWRSAFLLTTLLYLALIISLFLLPIQAT